MDTSTASFEDSQSPLTIAVAHKTASAQTDAAHPAAADWFTRLIAPLTHSSPVSLAAPAASDGAQNLNAGVKSLWAGGTVYTGEESKYRPASMQGPYPGPGSGGGGTVGTAPHQGEQRGLSTVLLIFIPVLVVVITVLVGLLCFLIAVLLMRRRRAVRLTEDGGPLDLSKSDGVIGEGGVEGVEARWLETVEPDVRAGYARAKGAYGVCVDESSTNVRLAGAVSPIIRPDRHHPIAIPVHPREGRLGMGVRTRLRGQPVSLRPEPHRNYLPLRRTGHARARRRWKHSHG
jgi:hypothetical protein